ncbi:MAG: MFS transporter, partial [Chloroflexi bacterium]|nr:MFS transporter [Chloroflexota bacterium]
MAKTRGSGGVKTFSTLRYRDFRLLWASIALASVSRWLQEVTIGWLVWDMTGSALLVGLIGGLRAAPVFIT